MKFLFTDAKKAHLNPGCKEDVYIELPNEAEGGPGMCGKLDFWFGYNDKTKPLNCNGDSAEHQDTEEEEVKLEKEKATTLATTLFITRSDLLTSCLTASSFARG